VKTNDDVIARLDALIRLTEMGVRLAALTATGDRSQRDKIALLDAAGWAPKEVADLLGTTPNTVSVVLYGLRKQQRREKGRGKNPAVENSEE
jgi:DNA-directed RNA polymerase specialized sigma24 family protein